MQSSAATFATANETTCNLALRRDALESRPLLLRTCPRCAREPATRLERHSLQAYAPGSLAAGLVAYALATTLASRAPDLVWYRSLLPTELYGVLLEGALLAVLAVPFLFAAGFGLLRLLRPRVSVRLAVCAGCHRSTQRRGLAATLGFALVVFAAIAATGVASTLDLTRDLGLAALVPMVLVGSAVYLWATRPGRISCVRASRTEVVLRVPVTVARVIERERPHLARRVGAVATSPRWLAPALAGAATLSFFIVGDEAALVCPMETTGLEREDETGLTHRYCVDENAQPHGRYKVLGRRGEVRVVGGFDQGRPSGLWAELPRGGALRLLPPRQVDDDAGYRTTRWIAAADGLPRPFWSPPDL